MIGRNKNLCLCIRESNVRSAIFNKFCKSSPILIQCFATKISCLRCDRIQKNADQSDYYEI